MTIAADDGHARLSAALLGPYHVHDAVAHVSHGEEFDTGLCRVAAKGLQLQARLRMALRGQVIQLPDPDPPSGGSDSPGRAAQRARPSATRGQRIRLHAIFR